MGGVLTDAAYTKLININIYILQGVPAMKELLQKHPDLEELITTYPSLKVYKITDNDKIVEYWEKNKDGHWVDQTQREKLREQIEADKEELEQLRRICEKGGVR